MSNHPPTDPGPEIVVLAAGPPEHHRLVGRTLRSAAARRPGAELPAGCAESAAEFGAWLERARPGPVVVLSPGAWLVRPPPGLDRVDPSGSSGWSGPGYPPDLLGLGATVAGPGREPWDAALRRHGGRFEEGRRWLPRGRRTLPPVRAAYLGSTLRGRLAALLRERPPDPGGRRAFDWQGLVESLAADRHVRVRRLSEWDLAFDPAVRTLQVITTRQRGGAERVTLELAEALTRAGHPAAVAVLAPPGREALPAPAPGRFFDLSDVPDRPAERAGAVHRAAAGHFGADLVHAHLLRAADVRALRATGIPLVVTVHNARPGWPPGFAETGFRAGDADLLAGCCQAVSAELLAGPAGPPVRTLTNGIDPGAFVPTPGRQAAALRWRGRWGWGPGEFVLLVLANPRPQKRWELLVPILAALTEIAAAAGQTPAASPGPGPGSAAAAAAPAPFSPRLVIAGSLRGPVAEAVAAAVRADLVRAGLTDAVRWTGAVEAVGELLAAVDLLLCPSRHEGLSLAWLEAVAAGKPVLTAAVGGAAELAAACPDHVQVLPAEAPAELWARAVRARAAAGPPPAALPGALPPAYTARAMASRARLLYGHVLDRRQAARARGGTLDPARPGTAPGGGWWLVTNNFSVGGAQSSARRLLEAGRRRGWPVRAAVVQEAAPTRGRRALAAAGVPVWAPSGPPGPFFDAVRVAAALAQAWVWEPPAVILLWNLIASCRLLLADALHGARVYDVSPGEMSRAALAAYFRRPRPELPYRGPRDYGALLAGAVVKYQAEAPAAAADLGCPVVVIPNGVAPVTGASAPPRPGPPRRLRLGTLARLHPDKRLEDLLAGFHRAHRRLPPYELRVAGGAEPGQADYARHLRRLARGLPVRWCGPVVPPDRFLRGLDGFVMISRPAGCPNALLEAMAHGLAVVATDWGGAGEQVLAGHTGWLTPDGDPAALAEALVHLGRDPTERGRRGRAAQDWVRTEFSLDRMADRYERLCRGGCLPAAGGGTERA